MDNFYKGLLGFGRKRSVARADGGGLCTNKITSLYI